MNRLALLGRTKVKSNSQGLQPVPKLIYDFSNSIPNLVMLTSKYYWYDLQMESIGTSCDRTASLPSKRWHIYSADRPTPPADNYTLAKTTQKDGRFINIIYYMRSAQSGRRIATNIAYKSETMGKKTVAVIEIEWWCNNGSLLKTSPTSGDLLTYPGVSKWIQRGLLYIHV